MTILKSIRHPLQMIQHHGHTLFVLTFYYLLYDPLLFSAQNVYSNDFNAP